MFNPKNRNANEVENRTNATGLHDEAQPHKATERI